MSSIYSTDGVNVPVGDAFSTFAGRLAKTTWDNSPYIEVRDYSRGHFRGPRLFEKKKLPQAWFQEAALMGAPDGIGTKVLLYDGLQTHHDAGWDLMAMTCGDITRYGGVPVGLWNVLDVKTLGAAVGSMVYNFFVTMMSGLAEAASREKVVILSGETAEIGVCVGTDNPMPTAPFNWAAVAIGLFHPSKLILGDQVQAGDIVIALREPSFRSNGYSSVRAAFAVHYGKDFYNNPDAQDDLAEAARPSILYDALLATANGWYKDDLDPLVDMRMIAHITGGGMGKFGELLKINDLSAELDDLWEPPEIMRKCAEWRGMTDKDIYETWNGGQGVLMVVPKEDVSAFLRLARTFVIQAKTCGEITDSGGEPKVQLVSKFSGERLTFVL